MSHISQEYRTAFSGEGKEKECAGIVITPEEEHR
jgi:hypothetical protein